ncbi:energy transducer TonB [Sphingoaurantiacus capsulatus]|uniref:Energy transducer TonB n=1 Tax=Sphingoaurantiacus capsulatus TaxID=1771310 RepID=A0ABV7X647_9SPHN
MSIIDLCKERRHPHRSTTSRRLACRAGPDIIAPMRLALAAALAATLAMPALAQGETRPAERIAAKGLITAADYPDKALRADEQGLTSIQFVVGEDGKVVRGSCVVAVTSRSVYLDRAACEIVERRSEFRPALENGVPVRETKVLHTLWTIPDLPMPAEPTLARRMLNQLASCLVHVSPAPAAALVDQPMGSAGQSAAAAAAMATAPNCNSYLKAIPHLQLAGFVGENLMQNRFRGVGPALGAGVAPLVARNGAEAMAQCIVRRDPLAARAVIDTVATSEAEAQALARLTPHLEPCIVEGTTLRLHRATLRAFVGIALYRDAVHAAEAKPTAK